MVSIEIRSPRMLCRSASVMAPDLRAAPHHDDALPVDLRDGRHLDRLLDARHGLQILEHPPDHLILDGALEIDCRPIVHRVDVDGGDVRRMIGEDLRQMEQQARPVQR
jgi:hypothetical protein